MEILSLIEKRRKKVTSKLDTGENERYINGVTGNNLVKKIQSSQP